MVWERLKPFVPVYRQQFRNPHMSENLEKVAQRFEKWSERRAPGHLAVLRQYLQQFRKADAAAD